MRDFPGVVKNLLSQAMPGDNGVTSDSQLTNTDGWSARFDGVVKFRFIGLFVQATNNVVILSERSESKDLRMK